MSDDVNDMFGEFINKNVIVELKDNNQSEGKVVAIDNYLNIVLQKENGMEALKGGNIIFVAIE